MFFGLCFGVQKYKKEVQKEYKKEYKKFSNIIKLQKLSEEK